jgi:hypothetical protein
MMAEIRAGREEMDRNQSHVRQRKESQQECLAGREDGLPRRDGGTTGCQEPNSADMKVCNEATEADTEKTEPDPGMM